MAYLDNGKIVTIFGGSGFIGRNIVGRLAKDGWRIRVAVRRPDLAGHLQPLGNVGQIRAVQANIRYPESIVAAIKGADAVINLVGILYESGKQDFDTIHVEGAKNIAKAVKNKGIEKFIHVSAITDYKNTGSKYAKSKQDGENAILEAFPRAIILRPSVVFGNNDQFFNKFAWLTKISPIVPLFGGGETKFQPVYVGDIAEAIAISITNKTTNGKIYELGGPEIMSLREIFEYILKITGRNRILFSLPMLIAKVKALFLQILPNPLITTDQLKLLNSDSIVSENAIKQGRDLSGLGITPTSINTIVPDYLIRFRSTGEFNKIKQQVNYKQ